MVQEAQERMKAACDKAEADNAALRGQVALMERAMADATSAIAREK